MTWVLDRDARILIVGAGPAGLSTAYFLGRHGFRNVTVFEKLGRVGGQCRTVTEHRQAFDLGATFVAPDFREVLRLAREHGAELDKFVGAAAFSYDLDRRTVRFGSLFNYVVGSRSFRARARFFGRCARYAWKRLRLRGLFRDADPNAFVGRSDLRKPFAQWLGDNGLEDLRRLFEVSVTAFGYGSLDELPAAYGLRYMSVRGLLAALLTFAPGARLLPGALLIRTFRHGYQRLWERIAWDLDVRLDVEISRIERDEEGVHVTYARPAELLDARETDVERSTFDYLVLACPLTAHELPDHIDSDAEELELLSRVRVNRYAVIGVDSPPAIMTKPIAVHIPVSVRNVPMIMLRMHPTSASVAFASLLPKQPRPDEELRFRESVERLLSALGGAVEMGEGRSYYNVAPYFRHFDADDLADGLLRRWDRRQGTRRTFYTGGLFDIDHVEGAVRAARTLVERHFVEGPTIRAKSPAHDACREPA